MYGSCSQFSEISDKFLRKTLEFLVNLNNSTKFSGRNRNFKFTGNFLKIIPHFPELFVIFGNF